MLLKYLLNRSMSDADALKKAIFRLSFNVCVTQFVTLNFKRNIGTAPEATGRGVPGVPALVSESDAERFERHRACFHFLSASQQRSCVSSVLSLFILLHLRCVSLQFVKLYGYTA